MIWRLLCISLWACQSAATSNQLGVCAEDTKPNLHTVEVDGKVTEVYFYGPPNWLSSPGERLGKFPDLEKITLACGTIGVEEMRYLATVRSLKHLATMEFSEDSVRFAPGSLNELKQMKWLESLEVYQNPLPIEEWRFLSELDSLTELHLDCFNGLSFIGEHNNLELLYLYRDTGSDLETTISQLSSRLKSVESLGICSHRAGVTPIPSGALEPLLKLPNLVSLRLDLVDQKGLDVIGRIVNLERLTFTSSTPSLDITSIRQLGKIQALVLNVNSLAPTSPAVLEGFSKMEFLSLRCEKDNNSLVERIRFERLLKLRNLYLWTADADDLLINRLAELPQLNEILVKSFVGDEKSLSPFLLKESGHSTELFVKTSEEK